MGEENLQRRWGEGGWEEEVGGSGGNLAGPAASSWREEVLMDY